MPIEDGHIREEEEALGIGENSDLVREMMRGSSKPKTPERELCMAILSQQVQRAIWTDSRPRDLPLSGRQSRDRYRAMNAWLRKEACEWVIGDDDEWRHLPFHLVCSAAGYDPDALRESVLNRLEEIHGSVRPPMPPGARESLGAILRENPGDVY